MADRTAHKPLRPYTVDHFRAYARLLVLDSFEPWVLDDWQCDVVGDAFSGVSGLWLLVPEENGKTTLMAGLGLYHGDYVKEASALLAASSRDQAGRLLDQMVGFVRRSPGARERFRPFEGYRQIRCLRTGGKIQVFAADERTGDGVIYTLTLIDELHRARDLGLFRTWSGKDGKREAQVVDGPLLPALLGVISTSGEPGGEFEDVVAHIRREGETTAARPGYERIVAGDTVMHRYALPDDGDPEDLEQVKAANPFSRVTAERLARKRAKPEMTIEHWLRFVCNRATLVGGSAITSGAWDRLAERGLAIPDDAPRWGWLDLGWTIDTTAMGVIAWESRERRLVTAVRVIQPPVDESDVVAGILRRQIDYGADGWVADPSAGGEQMIQLLEKGQHPLQTDDDLRERYELPPLDEVDVGQLEFIAHSQDNAPQAQASRRLDEAIRNGWLVHDGDRRLRAHVLNAVAKPLGGDRWRYARPANAQGERRKRYPIDALQGLLVGHNIACEETGRVRRSWRPVELVG